MIPILPARFAGNGLPDAVFSLRGRVGFDEGAAVLNGGARFVCPGLVVTHAAYRGPHERAVVHDGDFEPAAEV